LIPIGNIVKKEPFFTGVLGPLSIADFNKNLNSIDTNLLDLRNDVFVKRFTYLDFGKAYAWNIFGRSSRIMYIIVSDFCKDEQPLSYEARQIYNEYLGSRN